MGKLIVPVLVRPGTTGRGKTCSLYFDSGSPATFVRLGVVEQWGTAFPIPGRKERVFHGMGNGRFHASHVFYFEAELLDVWCAHVAFVVPDAEFEEGEDFLIGHDFTQRYDVKLDTKRHRLILARPSLLSAQRVRSPIR